MKVSKWPVGALLALIMVFAMSYYGLWSRLTGFVTGAVIVLLLLISVFVNIQITRD